MRDEKRRYEGSTFSLEKVVACLYLLMFAAILGLGVQKQIGKIIPGDPAPPAMASNETIGQR